MIHATHLTKRFSRERLALDDVSFEVKQGEIMGLLGHNGAGKSTIVGIMLGMVHPDAGEVMLGGYSVQRQRNRALRLVGSIFEAPRFYEYMSGWQNLRALCALSGWWEEKEVCRVLELVKLKDRVHSKVAAYSHGMRQRLALAQALLPMPKLLLLDEPTDGLDPEGIHEFRDTVLKLRKQNDLTILMNSHLLGEVEQMCDRCVVLQQGKKIYEGHVPSKGQNKTQQYILQTPQQDLATRLLAELHIQHDPTKGIITLDSHHHGPELLRALIAKGLPVESWTPFRQTLEDWYLQLSSTGGKP